MRPTRMLLLSAALLQAGLASAQSAPPEGSSREPVARDGHRPPTPHVDPDAIDAMLLPKQIPGTEASVGIGVQGIGYTFAGGRWGDLFITPTVGGRLLLGGLTLDGDLLVSVPMLGGGPGAGATLTLRAGYTGTRFFIVAGPSAQYTPGAPPAVQLLPSLSAGYAFTSRWGLSLGVFDLHALAPARLSLEVGDFGIGYVALEGVEAHALLHLNDLKLRVQALALALANTQEFLVTVSAVYVRPEVF